MNLAPRIQEIHPFRVMELLARARDLQAQGHDIIHLEVGEPDFPTPAPVLEAAQRFLVEHGGHVPYTPTAGLPALREAIADYYARRFGVAVSPERILVTTGASAALTLILAAATHPGDGWLIPDPGYPCNRHLVRTFEGQTHSIPVDAADNFQPTVAHVEQLWRANTRGLMLATPSNPTGTVLTLAQIAALAEAVRARGGLLIVDEIYQGLNYDGEACTALSVAPDAFIINSFSKYFGMTGWRLGWLVAPEGWAPHLEKLAQHLYICAPTPAQYAALAALSEDTRPLLEARREQLLRRRNVFAKALFSSGLILDAPPQGAFYLYADAAPFTDDTQRLAADLLEQAHVACTPGIDFGEHRTQTRLRFAYTTDEARLQEAAERIARVLQRR